MQDKEEGLRIRRKPGDLVSNVGEQGFPASMTALLQLDTKAICSRRPTVEPFFVSECPRFGGMFCFRDRMPGLTPEYCGKRPPEQ